MFTIKIDNLEKEIEKLEQMFIDSYNFYVENHNVQDPREDNLMKKAVTIDDVDFASEWTTVFDNDEIDKYEELKKNFR